MEINFNDKVAVITGGSRGIGSVIGEMFYRSGAKVALIDLNGEECARRALMIDPGGNNVAAFQGDVTDEMQINEIVGKIHERFKRIDILVNNAGILNHVSFEKKTVADFERIVKVNLIGAFTVCKAVVPIMKNQGKGKIINMSSLAGRTGRPGVASDYAAAKAGIVGMTQTLAKELGPAGIYVNAIAPGPIMTELTKQVSKEVFATWNVGRAISKDGLPEDIAYAAMFLASEMADWITGVTLDVNGGIFIP
jgi:NAD(P)-dependent dehydrogenase (short-subunit alcohol dehydrogenase family)